MLSGWRSRRSGFQALEDDGETITPPRERMDSGAANQSAESSNTPLQPVVQNAEEQAERLAHFRPYIGVVDSDLHDSAKYDWTSMNDPDCTGANVFQALCLSKHWGTTTIGEYSVITSRSLVHNHATVLNSLVDKQSDVYEYAVVRDKSVVTASTVANKAQVISSIVSGGSDINRGALVQLGSRVDGSKVTAGSTISMSNISKSTIEDSAVREESQVENGSLVDYATVRGGQVRGGAKVHENTLVSHSVVDGCTVGKASVILDGSVVTGAGSELRGSTIAGDVLITDTSTDGLIACCGSVIRNSTIKKGYVFGGRAEGVTSKRSTVLSLGEGCPLARSFTLEDLNNMSVKEIRRLWREAHPQYSQIFAEREPTIELSANAWLGAVLPAMM